MENKLMNLEQAFEEYDKMQVQWEEDDISYDDRLRELEWLIENLRHDYLSQILIDADLPFTKGSILTSDNEGSK